MGQSATNTTNSTDCSHIGQFSLIYDEDLNIDFEDHEGFICSYSDHLLTCNDGNKSVTIYEGSDFRSGDKLVVFENYTVNIFDEDQVLSFNIYDNNQTTYLDKDGDLHYYQC